MADTARAESDEPEIDSTLVAHASAAVDAGDVEALKAIIGALHEADLADLLTHLAPDTRVTFIRLLGEDFDYTALTELEETARVQILESLDPKRVAEGLAELDTDDAVYILEDLDAPQSEEILALLPY
ncbi:MAG: magnesium transporter, partial [Pseudomonadota bacterium]